MQDGQPSRTPPPAAAPAWGTPEWEAAKQFALLRKDPEGWFGYLQRIPAGSCQALFSPEIAPEVLEATAVAIAKHASPQSVAWAAEWLGGLSEVGRLAMTVMMLDQSVLAALRAMFDALHSLAEAEAEAEALAALPRLRKTFGVA